MSQHPHRPSVRSLLGLGPRTRRSRSRRHGVGARRILDRSYGLEPVGAEAVIADQPRDLIRANQRDIVFPWIELDLITVKVKRLRRQYFYPSKKRFDHIKNWQGNWTYAYLKKRFGVEAEHIETINYCTREINNVWTPIDDEVAFTYDNRMLVLDTLKDLQDTLHKVEESHNKTVHLLREDIGKRWNQWRHSMRALDEHITRIPSPDTELERRQRLVHEARRLKDTRALLSEVYWYPPVLHPYWQNNTTLNALVQDLQVYQRDFYTHQVHYGISLDRKMYDEYDCFNEAKLPPSVQRLLEEEARKRKRSSRRSSSPGLSGRERPSQRGRHG